MESVQLPYEFLAEIFKLYVALPNTLPETLLHVCRSWSAIASHEPILWTKFVISRVMVRNNGLVGNTLTWVGIFKRRLARAGPSHPFQVSISGLHELLLPVIDVVSGGAPDYIHLPRWETLTLYTTRHLIKQNTWSSIVDLISQPTPSLKRLTSVENKIDFHAFPDAPNLEELNVLYGRSPLIGQNNSFPNLKKIHIDYPPKYPLGKIRLDKFSRTLETLIIGGNVGIGELAMGEYLSLSMLEFTMYVPSGIIHVLAPSLRHLILRKTDLFPPVYSSFKHADPQQKNREVLKMLAGRFPTVEVLEVHNNLHLVLEIIFGEAALFKGLKELWATSKNGRKRIDLVHQ